MLVISAFALIQFWNYSRDYSLNCTPLGPITIIIIIIIIVIVIIVITIIIVIIIIIIIITYKILLCGINGRQNNKLC